MTFGRDIITKALRATAALSLVFASWQTAEGGTEKRWLILWYDGDEPLFWPVLAQSIFTTTPGSNFTITSDATWNSASNTVECVGAGASGAAIRATANGSSTGGGGGAYSAIVNFAFAVPGTTTATARVGLGGAAIAKAANGGTVGNDGGSSWFNNTVDPGVGADNSQCSAQGGKAGQFGTAATAGGIAGATASSWGQTKFAGGKGGATTTTISAAGTGGGGAGGPHGAGNAGTDTATAIATAGGTGDAGNAGRATAFDGTHGVGDGGAGSVTSLGTATSGGNYGAGGGGISAAGAGTNTSGAGAIGIVVLTWVVAATVVNTAWLASLASQRRTSSSSLASTALAQEVFLPAAWEAKMATPPIKKVAQEADTALADPGVFTPLAWSAPAATPPLKRSALRWEMPAQPMENFFPQGWGFAVKTPPLKGVSASVAVPYQDWPFFALAWGYSAKTPPLGRVATRVDIPMQDWPFVALPWGFSLITPPLKRVGLRSDTPMQDWPFTAMAWQGAAVSTRRTDVRVSSTWPMIQPDLIIVLDVMAWSAALQTRQPRTPPSLRAEVSRETIFIPMAWQAGMASRLALASRGAVQWPTREPEPFIALAWQATMASRKARIGPLLLCSTAPAPAAIPSSQTGPHAPLLRNRHSGKARVYWKGST